MGRLTGSRKPAALRPTLTLKFHCCVRILTLIKFLLTLFPGPKTPNTHDEKMSLKKVMDLVNKNSEHTQHTQEMNRKLQSMLEETLTKNMHLQKVFTHFLIKFFRKGTVPIIFFICLLIHFTLWLWQFKHLIYDTRSRSGCFQAVV